MSPCHARGIRKAGGGRPREGAAENWVSSPVRLKSAVQTKEMVGPGTAREGKKKGEIEGEEETGDYDKLLTCLERLLGGGGEGEKG